MTTHTLSPDSAFVPPVNFVECLRHLAASQPDKVALIVVSEEQGDLVETTFTYRAFDQYVRALAAVLQSRFSRSDRILILLDNDQHYAISMFACFYAGLIAVPVFPPESTRPQHLERLTTIAVDARANGILTIGAIREIVSGVAAGFGMPVPIAVDEVDVTTAGDWGPYDPASDDVAFLQYTSGSTSAPKGVMVTHGNLMANERAIREAMGIDAEDKLGVWSPLFHDMGLIGGLLQPFYSAIPCVLCSPRFFLERPVRWLELISRHGVTISGGPDFAYRLCLERVSDAQLETLDLSSWRVAYTGAEPVRNDTMATFIERYTPAGFNAGAVYPCYGLAEATLLVTGGLRSSGMTTRHFDATALSQRSAVPVADGTALVGCGRAPSAHEIRIVDPQSDEVLTAGEIGEIWVAGPSITAGYWNKPRETAEAFVESNGRRWLRTGDLGFAYEGEIYVAGRLKDMIIVRGHNLYPQDIERAVEADVEAVRKGRVAAFAVELDGEEGIGLAVEVSRGLQKLIQPLALVDVLRAAVSEQCGEAPMIVALLNAGTLPKTSSGKLQRSACRKGWKDRSLDAYAIFERGQIVGGTDTASIVASPIDSVAQELALLWREVLKHDATQTYAGDANFMALGGSSLAAVQLVAHIRRRWEIEFSPRLVFEYPRLQEQADSIRHSLQTGVRAPRSVIPVLSEERRSKPIPLSPAQRRQWFLWQFDPASTAYHVQGALRIFGLLDVGILSEAIASLAQRHEALRTVFRVHSDGDIEQVVDPVSSLNLQQIDLRNSNDEEKEALAAEALRALNMQPFDLTRGPLARAALIRMTDDVHVLALVMHHIISDGASMQILVDDLAALYSARLAGEKASTLSFIALQYTDYAVWHNDPGNRAVHERQLTYWCEQLAVGAGEAQPALALPTDCPRQPVARYRADQHHFELPNDLLIGLRQHAETHGTTLFTVLLAAFHALLYRYTGQQDIRVGVPVANRGRPELQGVVGFFVNTLVLRTCLDGRMSLAQVLALTRESALGAQANQELPFEQLVEALQPERSLSHSPLFQVMFNHLQEDYNAFTARTGLIVEKQWLPEHEVQFELTLDTREYSDGRVSAQLTYARELFEPSRMACMAGHYIALLRGMISCPEQALGDVEILDRNELRQLEQWGLNPERYPDVEPIQRLIERQAARQPDATALILGDETLSYAALEACANRLAHRLLALGLNPEQRVGLATDRSIDMVVALLAVLKAGGVFVPLDPNYPAERLAAMVEDSQIRIMLTQSQVRERLPIDESLHVLILDELDLSSEAYHAPSVALHADSLAYVIYTSGSTGKPKGVAVSHRALVEHVQLSAAFSSLTPEDRMLQFSTLNFDGFIEQLFPPLLVGAAVVLRGPALWSPDELLHELLTRRISIIDLPTAYWFALIQSFAHTGGRDYGSLREVHIGGEAMPAEAIPVWEEAGLSNVKLLNTYGPTEAVVVVSLLDCTPYVAGERAVSGHMPIGRPLPGRSLRVLDTDLQPVPAGVVGELYIGGPLLARGYLGRAGLTAERFVADPFNANGARLYRTGDRVRWSIEGDLEYLERADHQLKIRGFRVELGEIEAQLLAQPEVRETVVVAKEARLIAYVSTHAEQVIEGRELRARLTRVLPDYMVPSAIVVLESLPLNPNGKIDRNALPVPEFASATQSGRPQGEVEELLAAIWTQVLGVANVGIDDNFFDLGGHSLLLMRVHLALEEKFSSGLSLVDLFKYPTIATLAKRIKEGDVAVESIVAANDHNHPARRRRAALLQRKGLLERAH